MGNLLLNLQNKKKIVDMDLQNFKDSVNRFSKKISDESEYAINYIKNLHSNETFKENLKIHYLNGDNVFSTELYRLERFYLENAYSNVVNWDSSKLEFVIFNQIDLSLKSPTIHFKISLKYSNIWLCRVDYGFVTFNELLITNQEIKLAVLRMVHEVNCVVETLTHEH